MPLDPETRGVLTALARDLFLAAALVGSDLGLESLLRLAVREEEAAFRVLDRFLDVVLLGAAAVVAAAAAVRVTVTVVRSTLRFLRHPRSTPSDGNGVE